MAWVPIFISLTVICVSLLYYLLKQNKQYWKNLNVIGPEPHLFFGNYKEFSLRRVTAFELQQRIYNEYPTEKFVGLYRFNTPALLVRDLDVIQHVLISDFDSFVNRGMDFGEKFSENIARSCDNTWRLLRTRLSPIFTSGKLKNMLYLMENCGDKMLEYLNTEKSTPFECNILDIIKRYTIASISACAFGVDVDMKNIDKKLEKIGDTMFTQWHSIELFFICPSLLLKLGFNITSKETSEYFLNLIDIIKTQRNGKPSGRKDFMDLLLEMKNMSELKGGQKHEGANETVVPVTDNLIAAQAQIFFGAGFETCTNTLAYLLHELAKHQDIQEKIVEEIKLVLNENNGELSLDALKKLSYMRQAMDETLRMYSIVDLQRKVSAPSYTIPSTNVTLKRGDYVYLPTRGIHFDEKYYPEPHKFDPDRFSTENVKARHPCAYMPFGLGPRQCLGVRFAKVQLQFFLVKFLTHYRVEPIDVNKEFTYDPMKMTLVAKGGIPLKVVSRNK